MLEKKWDSLSPLFSLSSLVLNFDVNGTLILSDTAAQFSARDMINQALAKRAGTHPFDPAFSYTAFVDSQNLPRDERNRMLSRFVEQSKNNKAELINEVEKILRGLEEKKYSSPIFESFFHLVDELDRKVQGYHLVLRTFGTDLPEIVKHLEEFRNLAFIVGEFQGGYLQLGRYCQGQFVPQGKLIVEAEEIAAVLTDTRYLAIKDEYHPWSENQLKWKYGKKMPVIDDGSKLSLFFDDNIDTVQGSEMGIVRPVRYQAGKVGEIVDPFLLLGTHLFPVDTGAAILEKDYYLNLVQKALHAAQKRHLN